MSTLVIFNVIQFITVQHVGDEMEMSFCWFLCVRTKYFCKVWFNIEWKRKFCAYSTNYSLQQCGLFEKSEHRTVAWYIVFCSLFNIWMIICGYLDHVWKYRVMHFFWNPQVDSRSATADVRVRLLMWKCIFLQNPRLCVNLVDQHRHQEFRHQEGHHNVTCMSHTILHSAR